ncbi:MAG: response regulator [Elusimicrobia bacterium]|nr:response regulator [Elusimicrobiota bacterium]
MAETILVVDDDESLLEVCEVGLRVAGFTVATAASGEQAVKKVETQDFDLVLSDLQMPGKIDGNALVREVKMKRPTTEVIIMTGAPSLKSAVDSLKDGAYDYIVKPFHVDDLTATVRRCLDHRQLRKDIATERAMRHELEAAYTELQKVEQMKEAFLARLSHELKTPLSEFQMSLQLLEDVVENKLPDQYKSSMRNFVTMANTGAKRMNRTIMELLAFVDLQRRGVPEPRVDVDMEKICRTLVDRMRPLWEPKKITFDISFNKTITINGNYDILTCALEHLVQNAILFNKEGGRVVIKGENRASRIGLSIADTGEGIPETEFSKIFDSFYQIANYLTRKVDGLGLGLATTRRIIELHGGEIIVSSKVGEGTTFTILFPVAKPAEAAA